MSVGIGITTYNRQWKLQECLIRLGMVTPEAHRLVVADDGSSDSTLEYLRGHGAPFITGPNRGVAWNKNRALYALHQEGHDVVLLLEDDCFPIEEGWLSFWEAAVRRWGHVNYHGGWWPKELTVSGDGSVEHPYLAGTVTAQISGFRRDVIDQIGFFDSRFRGYGHEHVDLTHRIIRGGHGGRWYENDGVVGYEYVCASHGLTCTGDASFLDEAQVAANARVLESLHGEPLYRPAWRSDEERAVLLAEVAQLDAWR